MWGKRNINFIKIYSKTISLNTKKKKKQKWNKINKMKI